MKNSPLRASSSPRISVVRTPLSTERRWLSSCSNLTGLRRAPSISLVRTRERSQKNDRRESSSTCANVPPSASKPEAASESAVSLVRTRERSQKNDRRESSSTCANVPPSASKPEAASESAVTKEHSVSVTSQSSS